MSLKYATVGARRGEATITISKNTKLVTFSSGFFKHKLNDKKYKYIKQGYDEEKNQIGFLFCDEDDNSGQLLKLSYAATKNSASCGVTPILNNFGLSVDSIAGTYRDDAIETDDFSGIVDATFLLNIDKRKK